MDDSEYYQMMRNQYSHSQNLQTKKKKNQFDYSQWNSRQGREDAQMLYEKDSEHMNKSGLDGSEEDS